MSAAPLTLEAFADWLGGDVTDNGLGSALTIGIDEVERRCGPILPRPHTIAFYSGGGAMVLPVTRLAGTVTVTDPHGTVVTPSALNLAAGIVTVPSRTPGTWAVTVTPDPPPVDPDADPEALAEVPPRRMALVEAAYVIAGQIFNARRGRKGNARPHPAGSPTVDPGAPIGFAVPARALELMAPWRTHGL